MTLPTDNSSAVSTCASVLAVLVVAVACSARVDRGGQEGEEFDVGGQPERGLDTGVGGGSGGGQGDGGGGTGPEDLGTMGASSTGFTGERTHLRGPGGASSYDCELFWDADGQRRDELCPDCVYAFDVSFTLREADSTRRGYACADAWADDTVQLGFVPDYGGYGPAVVGIVAETLETYMLAPATVTSAGASWTYGYLSSSGSSPPGDDPIWYYRVDVLWKE